MPRFARIRQRTALLAALVLGATGCSHDALTDPVVTLGPVLAGAPLPPVASYTMITQGPVAKSILTVDGSASSDPNAGGSITNFAWNWGDGSAVQNTGTTPKAVHAYQGPGSYTLALTVTNNAALANTASQSITVAARDTFTFSYAPTTPAAGQAISFTPVNASPPAGDTSSFQWTFAGNVVTQTSGLTAPTGITYDSAGTWTVRVQRAYRSGPRQIITQPITIGAAIAPTGSVSCAPATVSNGTSVTCTPTLVANSGALSTYAWTETGGTPASAATASYAFTFNSGASLTPSLTATNTYQKSGAFPYTLTAATPSGSISCVPTAVTNGTSVTCSSASVTPGAGTLATYAWVETGGTPASATTGSYTFVWNTGASMTPTLTATNSYGKSAVFSATLTAPSHIAPFTMFVSNTGGCAAFTVNAATKYYCWGNNGGGLFGTGTLSSPVASADSLYPVTLAGKSFAVLLPDATGISTTDVAWAWGADSFGEVGSGAAAVPAGKPTVTAVSTAAVLTWKTIGIGYGFTRCGVSKTATAGKMYCWGRNASGVTGHGVTTSNTLLPTLVTGTYTGLTTWTEAASAYVESCGLAAGLAYCWGANTKGEIGNGTTSASVTAPAIVSNGANTWIDIAVTGNSGGGTSEVCAIASGTGLLWCWGDDSYYGLGAGSIMLNVTVPTRASTALAFTKIRAYTDGFCGLSGGHLYCGGANSNGALGVGDSNQRTSYTLAFGGKNVVDFYTSPSAGVICILEQGTNTLYCAGNNNGNGSLGTGDPSSYGVPTPAPMVGQP